MPDWTPGPWTLTRNGNLLGPDGEKLLLSGVRLLMNGTPAEVAEARANTRLLWVCPDLLAACELALPHLVHELAADTVRAAIAKAKGVTDDAED
jgi:hypothetical protein